MEQGLYKLANMAAKCRVNAAREDCAVSPMASCRLLYLLENVLFLGIGAATGHFSEGKRWYYPLVGELSL